MKKFPFYLKLETVATDCKPEDAIESLIEKSKELGIPIQTNINGDTIFVHPNSKKEEAIQQWKEGIYNAK